MSTPLFENRDLDLRNWQYAGPVERAYELSRSPVTMIVGPTGGGKTTGSGRRYLRVATWQHASPRDGIRRARILCLCPTYRRAWDTIIPSYFKVYPQTLGEFRGSRGDPADHVFDLMVNIGGQPAQLHVETLFRAVSDLDLEDFFRGFEITAMHLPEADTHNDLAGVLSLGANRCGRYPEPEDRPEIQDAPAYKGIFGDANAPMIGTHFHQRFYLERGKHPGDRLLIQPGGFSAHAENIQNLRRIDPNYYASMAAGLDAYDVLRLVHNRPGYGRHGKPVHPNFDQDFHVATRQLEIDPRSTVYIGADAGSGALTPAATFSQRSYSGQWRTLAEIYIGAGQMNTEQFGHQIRQVYGERFAGLSPDFGAVICGDPAMGSRNASSSYSTALELQHHTGIEVQLAPSNDPKKRRSAIDRIFLRNAGPREPAKIIDPRCIGLIQGYAGGFHYQKRGNIVSPVPAKNEFSHVCEADEYAALTIEGLDARDSPFIRLEGEASDAAPMTIHAP